MADLRCFTILLFLTQTCFHPAHISAPKGAYYNACCHYRRKALLKHISIASCQILIFYGWVNQSPHNSIAAHRVSNPWPFGYESYAITYCAITALHVFKYLLQMSKLPPLGLDSLPLYFTQLHALIPYQSCTASKQPPRC